MVVRLIVYRLLGVETYVNDLHKYILHLEKRVKSLEDTLYNFADGQEELLKELKPNPEK